LKQHRFHIIPVRMAIMEKTTNAGEDVGKKEPSDTISGNAK
jgi:hypothetical protein